MDESITSRSNTKIQKVKINPVHLVVLCSKLHQLKRSRRSTVSQQSQMEERKKRKEEYIIQRIFECTRHREE